MVNLSKRSHSYARKKYKAPGGESRIRYVRRKPKYAHCGLCGHKMLSVPRLRPAKMRHTLKRKRRPNRYYGGNYCPECLEIRLKQKVLQKNLSQ